MHSQSRSHGNPTNITEKRKGECYNDGRYCEVIDANLWTASGNNQWSQDMPAIFVIIHSHCFLSRTVTLQSSSWLSYVFNFSERPIATTVTMAYCRPLILVVLVVQML